MRGAAAIRRERSPTKGSKGGQMAEKLELNGLQLTLGEPDTHDSYWLDSSVRTRVTTRSSGRVSIVH